MHCVLQKSRLITEHICSAKNLRHSLRWKSTKSEIGLFGACFDQGQPHQGVGEAPSLIRQAGLLDKLRKNGFNVKDYGDLEVHRVEGKVDSDAVLRFNKDVSERVASILNEDKLCVTLGGDHSVGLGTVAGHLKVDPEAVVLWVDAHADINTIASSDSGNMHGMPVSFNILQLEDENRTTSTELSWLNPSLSPSRLAYIGLRDVDAAEWKYIQKFSIPSFPVQAIDRIGIRQAVESAINMVDPRGERNIHLSFDIDVLDPVEAPATGTKVRGGLSLREALTLCELVQETGRLTALDLVEVNPFLARSQHDIEQTVEAAVEVILAAMGRVD